MSVAIKKIEGVDGVEVSLNEGVADITLKPGNSVTVDRVRDVVRSNGFMPKDAHVQVTGKVVERGGRPALEVSGLDVVYLLAPVPQGGRKVPKETTGKKVTVTGRVPEAGREKASQPLTLEVASVTTD